MQGTSTISNKMSALYDNFCSKFKLVRCTPCEHSRNPCSSGSSSQVRGGQKTWNLCCRLRRPSFYDLFLQGRGRGVWHPWPPPGSATAMCLMHAKFGNLFVQYWNLPAAKFHKCYWLIFMYLVDFKKAVRKFAFCARFEACNFYQTLKKFTKFFLRNLLLSRLFVPINNSDFILKLTSKTWSKIHEIKLRGFSYLLSCNGHFPLILHLK